MSFLFFSGVIVEVDPEAGEKRALNQSKNIIHFFNILYKLCKRRQRRGGLVVSA